MDNRDGRKKIFISAAVLISLITLSSCNDERSSGESVTLKCESLECNKIEALVGNKESSVWVVQNVKEQDRYYWLGVSAQNGVPASMYTYSLLLASNGVREECLRAFFWAKKAEDGGVKKALKLRKLLEKQRAVKNFDCGCAPYDLDLVAESGKCLMPKKADLSKYDPSGRLSR